MQADLEFEYPHKLEKMIVKGNVLDWLDEEEQKLKMLASEVRIIKYCLHIFVDLDN